MLSKAKNIFTTIGGCASKPKVLEGGVKTEEAPEEAVEKVAEETNKVAMVTEEEGEKREVVITSGAADAGEGSTEEINKTEAQATVADDENVGVKSRSLGNLFLENEEEKESNKSEAVTKESTSSEVKPTEQVETVPLKAEEQKPVSEPVLEEAKAAATAEENKLPEVVKLVANEAENAVTSEKKSEEVPKADSAAANDHQEPSDAKKETEEIVKPLVDVEVKQAIPIAENVQKSETDEKKSEEVIKSGKDEQSIADQQQSAKTTEEIKQVIVSENVEISEKAEEVKEPEKKVEDKTETLTEKKEEAKQSIGKTENQA
ncbi:OLC1v1008815C1 [Oldenlandia corymbosa var. corymbosa]|uniref:OLC1v1008815C1 n=1 Tax=Oldenlandia corymbosa var. corymbosa TaxID=529605 RepID=A0AAV1DMG9_OLDCO|nr:OLC1v1008815C1 [Oldenlandia corymbosa var. corymbosa]